MIHLFDFHHCQYLFRLNIFVYEKSIQGHVRSGLFSSLGDYMIVAGRLLNGNLSDRAVIDVYKIESLKTISPHELNWPYEVIDISQRVYHQSIEP